MTEQLGTTSFRQSEQILTVGDLVSKTAQDPFTVVRKHHRSGESGSNCQTAHDLFTVTELESIDCQFEHMYYQSEHIPAVGNLVGTAKWNNYGIVIV